MELKGDLCGKDNFRKSDRRIDVDETVSTLEKHLKQHFWRTAKLRINTFRGSSAGSALEKTEGKYQKMLKRFSIWRFAIWIFAKESS